jgi:hypothetical protein
MRLEQTKAADVSAGFGVACGPGMFRVRVLFFRSDSMSYQELDQLHREKQASDKMMYKPGTVFYAR